jgi:RNA-directed DNA polymerase
MKRYGNLFPEIITFENLLKAAKKAQKGKQFYPNVLKFNYNLETELLTIQEELINKTYQPGLYRSFRIFEPKPRLISAAPYRDRVIHHTLCNIIIPIFERTFIHDSYANREGFGTHKALHRFTNFYRNTGYILQCDIKRYFPSIDHLILKSLIRKKIKCPDTLWLIDTIIDYSNEQEPVIDYFPGDNLLTPIERKKGLPIGNLSSQLFANIYLNGLDHYIKENIKCQKYLRYVDDFALFSDDLDFLQDAKIKIEEYLINLRLKIHPIKSQLFSTQQGANFLGFRIFPERIRVRNDNLRRARIRLKRMQTGYNLGLISLKQLIQKLQSWESHLKHGDTYKLRQNIFDYWVFSRAKNKSEPK